ncbi:MAG TPA: hypothetical protein VGO34_02230 [Alphaproteobacteria bacterium]|jgi:hypothetical protein
MGGITTRIAATILVIVVLAAALQTVLTVSKFDGAFTNLLQSRLSVVVLDVRDTVETSLNLGLPLNALVNTQEVLDGERAQDGHILSIVVHDRAGKRVFDTETALIGERIPAAWEQRFAGAGTRGWSLRDPAAFIVGVPLINSLGERVGGIVLRYDHTVYDEAFRSVLRRLTLSAAAVLAVGLVLVYVAVVWLFGPMRRHLGELDAALGDEQAGSDASQGHDGALLAGHLGPLHRALTDVRGRIAHAAALLTAARDKTGGAP